MEASAGPLLRAGEQGDTTTATDVLLALYEAGTPVATIVSDVIAPCQEEVGRRWEQAEWTVAHEHAATAVVDAAFARLMADADTAGVRRMSAPRVVIACVEHEWHAFPGRTAATVLGAAGLDATFLGPSVPSNHLHHYLQETRPDACGLSCTFLPNLVALQRGIAAAHAAGVPVIASGRALGDSSDRACFLGADAWASDGA